MGVDGLICISAVTSLLLKFRPTEEQVLAVFETPAPVYIQGNKVIHIKDPTI